MLKKIMTMLSLCTVILFCSACISVQNNDKRIEDLSTHMLDQTKATFLCVMEPGPVHAESGFSIFIENKQVAFYKYNTGKKKMKKKLDWIREHGYLYIYGIKYTAAVHGSFVMIDYDRNKAKDKLLKAFNSF